MVARSQIDLFAVDRRVRCHFPGGRQQVIGTRNVGVRKNIYSARRPDGTLSTEFERAIGPVENNGIGVLREIDARWPPSDPDRVHLCEYLGLQAVRSPAYRDFFEGRREATLAERSAGLPPARRAELEAAVRSGEFRIENVGGQVAKMASLFGFMHLSLLRFPSPRLLCSDHPLAPVPFLGAAGAAVAAIPATGFLNTIEFRFPIGPNRALLLCWREHEDDFPVIDARTHHLRSINASVRDQAEQHWFHRPDVSAPCTSGTLIPISFELFDDYEWPDPVDSERRRLAEREIERMIENDVEDKMVMTTVTARKDRGADLLLRSLG